MLGGVWPSWLAVLWKFGNFQFVFFELGLYWQVIWLCCITNAGWVRLLCLLHGKALSPAPKKPLLSLLPHILASGAAGCCLLHCQECLQWHQNCVLLLSWCLQHFPPVSVQKSRAWALAALQWTAEKSLLQQGLEGLICLREKFPAEKLSCYILILMWVVRVVRRDLCHQKTFIYDWEQPQEEEPTAPVRYEVSDFNKK